MGRRNLSVIRKRELSLPLEGRVGRGYLPPAAMSLPLEGRVGRGYLPPDDHPHYARSATNRPKNIGFQTEDASRPAEGVT
jgi:hypothetical protein